MLVPVTAVIVCRNEQHWLRRCLESVEFCAERLVIDLDSTDGSARVARSLGARVIPHRRVAIVEHTRALAAAEATHDWLLMIDPDELVPTGLAADVAEFVASDSGRVGLVSCPWRFHFKGKPLRGTVWGGEQWVKSFLVHRQRVRLSTEVHGTCTLRDGFGAHVIPPRTENYLRHDWFTSWPQFWEKHRRYLTLEGEARCWRSERFSRGRLVKVAPSSFRDCYLRDAGYRDGFRGLLLSLAWAWYETMALLSLRRYERSQGVAPFIFGPVRRSDTLRRAAASAVRRAGIARRSEIDALRAAIAELTPRVDWLGARTDALEEREGWHVSDIETLKTLAGIEALRRWVRQVTLNTDPRVSVIMPTRNRLQYLPRAIESVLAQRYRNWELLVVDDGGDEDSRAVASAPGDSRIRWSRIPHGGVSAARNAGLKAASGQLVTYLDDDNVMDPDWLFTVVWAFEQRPEVDVLYGAIVIDDYLRVTRESSGALPWTFLQSFDRESLQQRNLADIGAIAHRAGLREAYFDEGISEIEDWDLLARLTSAKDPLVLPTIACYYGTDAPNRTTKGPNYDADLATVTARIRGSRARARSRSLK
ncbi:MAG: glycosyltransferase [Solirubrobacterales bacterium]|nr:glycosyltransferase [Solirubrobacterales bacterium]